MALGVLLILSASFLAVQLWSDGNIRRGAAQALEAPVMPMVLDTKKNGKPKKAIKPVKKLPDEEQKAPELPVVNNDPVLDDAGSVELPDVVVAEPKVVQKPETVVEKTLPESKPELNPEKKADPKPVADAVKPENVEQKADSEVVESKPVHKTAKKAVSPKASRGSRKAKQVVEEDITVVPPEWNWFSTPLKAELKHGQVEIVPAIAPIDFKLVSVAAKTVDSTGIAVVKSQPAAVEDGYAGEKKVAAPVMDSHKPFAKALERMAKIRRIRESREKKAAEKKEEVRQVTVVDEVSPSMRKLGETLRKLSEKLEKSPAGVSVSSGTSESSVSPTEADFEEAPPVNATGGSESLESDAINSQLQPYYSGSGSSFSNRVNELIKKGSWLKD